MSYGEYLGAGSTITKGLWHLNGNSNDSSGNGKNGTDTNITYSLANGKFGQGAGFNGSSSKIVVASSDVGITNSFTIVSCFKSGISDIVNTTVFELRQNSGANNYIGIQGFTGSTFRVLLYNSSGTVFKDYRTSTSIAQGVFYCVIVTWDGTNLIVYLNGNKETLTKTIDTSSSQTNTNRNIYIGVEAGTGNYWNGSLDEIILENVAWSEPQIYKHTTYTRGRFGIL